MNKLVLQNSPQSLMVVDEATQALTPITQEAFLKEWAVPQAMAKYRQCTTALACLESKAPTIAEIRSSFGHDYIQAYVEMWIVNLRMFFNVGKAMTDEQTYMTAELIVDSFYNLNIADINLVFKNAKLGKYGKIYDRLDGNIILEWFQRYFDERCEAAAERSIREAHSYRVNSGETKERLNRIIENTLNKK